MEHKNNNNGHLLIGLFFLALSIVISTMIVSHTAIKIKRTSETITVTGSAKQAIVSDFVTWKGSVSTRGKTMQDGYREISKYMTRIKEYFSEAELPDSIITFSSISSYSINEYDHNGRDTGRILGYNVTQSFEIKSNHVERITDISRSITDLMQEGIPLNSFPPRYIYTRLAEMRIEMLADATRDAKLRAEKIASGTGQKVGTVKEARMGVFQVTPRHSTAVSDYGMYDTSTIEKDITAVVRVSFALE